MYIYIYIYIYMRAFINLTQISDLSLANEHSMDIICTEIKTKILLSISGFIRSTTRKIFSKGLSLNAKLSIFKQTSYIYILNRELGLSY